MRVLLVWPRNLTTALNDDMSCCEPLPLEYLASALVDRHEVIIHDERLDRTTDGSGRICDHSFAELQQVNAAVNQMDQVTQQNASLVEEAAAATDQLASQADRLTGLVAVFNVKEHVEAVTEVGRSQAVPVVS